MPDLQTLKNLIGNIRHEDGGLWTDILKDKTLKPVSYESWPPWSLGHWLYRSDLIGFNWKIVQTQIEFFKRRKLLLSNIRKWLLPQPKKRKQLEQTPTNLVLEFNYKTSRSIFHNAFFCFGAKVPLTSTISQSV